MLACCPVAELIPFQLWHMTSFTMDFVNYVVSLVTAGVSLGTIEEVVRESRIKAYSERKQVYNQLIKLHNILDQSSNRFPTYENYKEHLLKSISPSRHSIS